ncbi:hypothetical protein ACFL2J_06370 [Candidatus Omnitrophota bacterium]
MFFTTTYFDTDGWENIRYAQTLISTSSYSKRNCFYARYSQNSNELFLRDDGDDYWLGGYSPGSANTIENPYAELDCSQTIVSGSDDNLTITWAVTFKQPFIGDKNSYLYVRDDNRGRDGWDKRGTWTITEAPPNNPPQGSIIINNGAEYTTGSSVVLTLDAQDPDGVDQMQFSDDNTNWSTPEAYSTTKNWTLDSSVGTKIVYVKYSDSAGNWSDSFSDSIFFDDTAPIITIVIDDGDSTFDTTQLHASWLAQDESPITEYQYAIGTTQGEAGSDVVGWTSTGLNTEATATGLSLLIDQTYYFNVKAKNVLGLWSGVGSSDGIIVLSQSQDPLEITSLTPVSNSTFTVGDIIDIVVQAQGGSTLEYRYLVDGGVIQNWTLSNTYAWQTQPGDFKLKTITVEVRDQSQATDSQETIIFLYRKPPQPE